MNTLIIFPEPHCWDKNISTVQNSLGEVKEHMNFIRQVVEHAENPVVISPGDLFHRGFSDFTEALYWISYWIDIQQLTSDNVYTVVGNHELSYPVNNPFWSMIDNHSDVITKSVKFPVSMLPIINVCDNKVFSGVQVVFGHYGVPIKNYTISESEPTILITHNNILTPEIANVLKNKYHRKLPSEYLSCGSFRDDACIPHIENLKEVFIGHMHTAYSNFTLDEMMNKLHMKFGIHYLGSTGRTNASEFNDDDLERTVFCLKVDSGSYEIETHKFSLYFRDKCIKNDVVRDHQDKYDLNKKVKEIHSRYYSDKPMNDIRSDLIDYPEQLNLLEHALSGNPPQELYDLLHSVKGI
jgi:hypothetical protein